VANGDEILRFAQDDRKESLESVISKESVFKDLTGGSSNLE
jgi:hypothetical protein